MSGQSTTRTVPGSGGPGTARTGRTGQVLSNVAVALGLVLFLGGFVWGALLYRPYTVPTTSMASVWRAFCFHAFVKTALRAVKWRA